MKIQIVEDDPISRRILEINLLQWGYEVEVASNGKEAWEIIQSPEAPNLVISDWMMPVMDGLELCRKVRQMEKLGYIYFIILSAKGKKEEVIDGLEAGADDFLIKPFDQEELRCRVKIGERIINLEQQILQLASTDVLTGVLNRRAFMERMEQEINRALRENISLSLIMSDIDNFKKINDMYGHQAGDLVLRGFADQLSKFSRPYDFVGRYGGEEFVICLSGVKKHHGRSVAERMRKEVEEMRIMLENRSKAIQITGSFGVASLCMRSEESVDSITGRADDAMYRAKKKGKNRVCMAGKS